MTSLYRGDLDANYTRPVIMGAKQGFARVDLHGTWSDSMTCKVKVETESKLQGNEGCLFC